MPNLFNIPLLSADIQAAKDKAVALAGQLGINGLLGGRVLPPLPPYPAGQTVSMAKASGYNVQQVPEELTTEAYSVFGVPMCFPLSLKPFSWPESAWWLLPTEPMVSIGGGNTLVRRQVAKKTNTGKALRGSIKESWATDDYTINIAGLLTKSDDWTYPFKAVQMLQRICEAREHIEVRSDQLNLFGISRLVIEKYDFPFTKGDENQAYTISAYSDDAWDLFLKLDAN